MGDRVPLLRLNGVTKSYSDNQLALDGINLEIEEGEFLSILGPSGCGKSTLLRLIAGLEQPTTGGIVWEKAPKADIGFVFQEPTLMPWATALQNIWLPQRLKGVNFAMARPQLQLALDRVGLSKFGNAYPHELSGGMKMRVSIARALVNQPQVLLLDEPFAALDEMTRLKLNHDLLDLKRDLGTTIVFVTHSVFESVFLSSRIVVLAARPGRVLHELQLPPNLERTDAFRHSSIYSETCTQALARLQSAMRPEDLL